MAMRVVMIVTALLSLTIAGLLECDASIQDRIVGGVSVTIQDYPYQVSIQSDGSHICGGSLIADSYVLTSAHCTEGRTIDSFKVRIGSSYNNVGGQLIGVGRLFQHPNFNYTTVDYDVTVMELEEAVPSDLTAAITELAGSDNELPYGSIATVTGWGFTHEGGNLATQLQKLDVPVIDQSSCESFYKVENDVITERMFCAGFAEGMKDSCQADSGGPLVYNGKQIGIVSWGHGCARPEFPGVYANVAKLRSFIDGIVN